MQIIYNDTNATRSADPFRLVRLKSGWHVVANGYLCKVLDEKEGRRVMADLRNKSLLNPPSIDKPPTGSYTSLPGTP